MLIFLHSNKSIFVTSEFTSGSRVSCCSSRNRWMSNLCQVQRYYPVVNLFFIHTEMDIYLTDIFFLLMMIFIVISQATTILTFLGSWFFRMVLFSVLNYLEGLRATHSLLIRQEIGLGLFYLTLTYSSF